MGLSDHGGFDAALELSEELVRASITGSVAFPLPADRDTEIPDLRLRLHVRTVTVDAVDLQVGERLALGGQFVADGIVLRATINGQPVGLPAGLGPAELRGTFVIPCAVGVGTLGATRGVVVTPLPADSTCSVNQNALFASPPVQLVLAAAFIAGGETAFLQRRKQISDQVEVTASGLVRDGAAAIPLTLAVAEPGAVTFAAVRTSAVTLKVLAAVALPAGNPALATAISARRNALGGALDHVALVLNNATLLSAVRTTASAALGISAAFPPWTPGHPCVLFSSTPITVPGIPTVLGTPVLSVFLDFFQAQVNAVGLLQLDVRIRGVGPFGLATVITTATATAPFLATVAAGTLTLALGPPAIAVTSDVQISPMLYLIALLLGQFSLLAVLSAIDLLAGPFISTLITIVLGGIAPGLPLAVAIPLAGPIATPSSITVSAIEPGAPIRVVTLPFIPFPLPLDRAQDVTVRLT